MSPRPETHRTETHRTDAPLAAGEPPRRPRRWLAAAIAAAADHDALPALPFRRGARRRPAALAAPSPHHGAVAAR